MPIDRIVLITVTLLSIATAVAAMIRDRKVPELTVAQATASLVSSDQVKAEIKRMSEQSNMSRDLRILDLENWGDKIRPFLSKVVARDNMLLTLIREDRVRCNLPMPDIAPLEEPPPFPEPRPMPA